MTEPSKPEVKSCESCAYGDDKDKDIPHCLYCNLASGEYKGGDGIYWKPKEPEVKSCSKCIYFDGAECLHREWTGEVCIDKSGFMKDDGGLK